MRFRSHEKNTCHCVAVEGVVQQTQDVAEMLVYELEETDDIDLINSTIFHLYRKKTNCDFSHN